MSSLVYCALLTFLACFQLTECHKCRGKFTCPNTTVEGDFSTTAVLYPAQRDTIRRVYNLTALPYKLTNLGEHFLKAALSHVDTDSPRLLNILFLNAYYLLPLLHILDHNAPLCAFASVINDTVIWAETNDGKAIAETITRETGLGLGLCQLISYISLNELNCPEIGQLPVFNGSCYRRGRAYEIERALALWGRELPCDLLYDVRKLYSSSDFSDNTLGIIFITSLQILANGYVEYLGYNQAIETLNFILNNRISKCCCPKRAQRLQEICSYHNATAYIYVDAVINTIFLPPEC